MTASTRDDEPAMVSSPRSSSPMTSSPTGQAAPESTMASVNEPAPNADRSHRPNILTGHSSFLSPYLCSEPSSSTSTSTTHSESPATTISPFTSRPNAPLRPRNTSSRSTLMRRRAALEDLCLGVEGVPVHRDMLNDFTGVVKRVFGTRMSMVSIMRDDLEMIGTSLDGLVSDKDQVEHHLDSTATDHNLHALFTSFQPLPTRLQLPYSPPVARQLHLSQRKSPLPLPDHLLSTPSPSHSRPRSMREPNTTPTRLVTTHMRTRSRKDWRP